MVTEKDAEMSGNHVAMDNCTDCSIFVNKQLLKGLRRSEYDWVITGHKRGSDLVMNTEGDFLGLPVLHSKGASGNVLCQRDVGQKYNMFEIPNWGIRVMVQDRPYDFILSGKRFILDTRKPVRIDDVSFSKIWTEQLKKLNTQYGACCIGRKSDMLHTGTTETVAGNEAKYTRVERERAAEALDIVRKIGLKSPVVVADMLKNGAILNCPLTAQDVSRAVSIHNRPDGYWEGKMHDRKSGQIYPEYLPPLTKKNQIAHCDIFFVAKKTVFVALLNPLNLAVTVLLQSTRQSEVERAIRAVQGVLSFRGCVVHTVIHDPERSIAAASNSFPKILFEESNVKGHVILAERVIEELKEIMRSVRFSLPFELANVLFPFLIIYATIRRNSVFNKSLGLKMSPKEALTGRKLDYKRDLDMGFGDFAKVYSNVSRKNSMDRRSIDSIALYPTGNLTGAWVFLHLSTLKPIVRGRWVKVPMSDLVIKLLNDLAADKGVVAQIEDSPNGGEEGGEDLLIEEPEMVLADPAVEMVTGDKIEEEEEEPVTEEHIESFLNSVLEPGVQTESIQSISEDVLMEETDVPENGDNLRKELRSGKAYAMRVNAKVLAGNKKRISTRKALQLHKDKAMDSMFTELKVLNDKGTFDAVDPNSLSKKQLKTIIRSFMFLTEKYDAEGNFVKLKSRLVAMGSEQDRDLLEMDVSSPTVSSSSIYTVAAIAAVEKRHVMSLDIGSAFLNAVVEGGTEILVKLDKINSQLLCQLRPDYKRFLTNSEELIVKLDKALYGCVQSARLWYNNFTAFLLSIGYMANPKDMCVFNKCDKDGIQVTVVFHVDDVMITSCNQLLVDEFEKSVVAAYENVSVTKGKKHSYLGRLFDFSVENDCRVSMSGYINGVMEDENVVGTASSPASNDLYKINPDAVRLNVSESKHFYSVVQRLLYLTVQFRRDLGVAIGFLTTRVREPDVDDVRKLDRVLKYLNGTRELCLVFRGDGTGQLSMCVSIDAAFGLHGDGKSHSGYVATIAGGSVEAKSKKQSLVTKNSTEAEMVALSDMSSIGIGWREFIIGQGYNIGAIDIEQDKNAFSSLSVKREINRN